MDEYKKYKLKKLKEDARLGFFCFFAYPIIFYVLMLLLPILINVLGSDIFSNFPFIIIRGMMWLIFGLASLFIFPFGFYIWVLSISNIYDFLKAKYIKKKVMKNIFTKMGLTKEGRLMRAARDGNLEKTKNLIKQGYDPDSKTKGGYTALMGAAMNGHLDIVNTLLDVGANPDIKFKDGRTALFGAVHQGHADIVKVLLEAGTDPNLHENTQKQTPLHFAAYRNHSKVIKILIDHGADTDAKEESGYTPLFFSVFKGHTEALMALLRGGADPNAKGNEGEELIELSVHLGYKEITSMLIMGTAREERLGKIFSLFEIRDK